MMEGIKELLHYIGSTAKESLGIPLIIILIISFVFYKNKKVSISLHIIFIVLGTLAGFIWGGISDTCSAEFYHNPVATYPPFIIGIILGIMCKFPKTTFFKVTFGILITIFVLSPWIASFFPCVPLKSELDWYLHQEEDRKIADKHKELKAKIEEHYKTHKVYPQDISLLVPIPKISIFRRHSLSNKVLIVSTKNKNIKDQITDEGGWIYSPDSGDIRINCSHKDSIGVPYYEW